MSWSASLRSIFLFLVFVSGTAWGVGPEATYAKNGMVSSRSTIASQVGVEIMRSGGNAVDAAVATGFALAVTYPSAGNLGGGGFAVVRLSNGEVVTLDHRETAPATATKDMYLDENGTVIKGLSRASHKASGVPGSVDGLLELLEKHGTRTRQEVLAPAIRLANDGFPLSHDMARQFKQVLPGMKSYPASVKKFSNNGVPYQEGDIWKQPDLGKSLELISGSGRDGFYKGRTAELIVEEMQRGGGEISLADLSGYRSVWRSPVKGSYRGYEIWSMGPPSSGGVLLIQMLNMIEPYDLAGMQWGSASAVHLVLEAERRAFADRSEHMGDADYYDVPVERLISKQYARKRFVDFDPARASDSEKIGPGSWPVESRETTHYSVLDKSGMAVAFTTTLNSSYGNKIVATGTGILLNNEMDDFSIKENTANQYGLLGKAANSIEPGKRMLSSMTPTIVTREGTPVIVTGSPGGSTIITTVLQILLNVIDFEMNIDDAVSFPRFHHQWKPDAVVYEKNGLSPDTRTILEKMGHKNFRTTRWGRGIGDANSILFRDQLIHGIKDPRNEGVAVGF
jgi:gamma-glutamyltranspeptidase/glutathione hydrolase